jgi:UDP-2,3-diacylglucosamine pyrophosphatase LpxH
MSAIIAFSDVHLGYDSSDTEAFLAFMHELQNRNDLGDVVIVGDFIDLWRRDVVGLEFELSKYIEELKTLQKKVNIHYVVGNHDFHVGFLKNHAYPFTFQPSMTITRFGYAIHFLHGHQCDPLQNVLGPDTSEILCWTMSDDVGEWKSKLWDIFGQKSKLSREDFEANLESLMTPPEVEFPYKIVNKKRRPGLKAKATITKVQLVKASEIFKDKAKDPEQQLYAIQGRVDGRDMRIATFTKPQGEEISSKSRLAQFKQHYKQFPKVGLKVDVVTDENGYWKIAL